MIVICSRRLVLRGSGAGNKGCGEGGAGRGRGGVCGEIGRRGRLAGRSRGSQIGILRRWGQRSGLRVGFLVSWYFGPGFRNDLHERLYVDVGMMLLPHPRMVVSGHLRCKIY